MFFLKKNLSPFFRVELFVSRVWAYWCVQNFRNIYPRESYFWHVGRVKDTRLGRINLKPFKTQNAHKKSFSQLNIIWNSNSKVIAMRGIGFLSYKHCEVPSFNVGPQCAHQDGASSGFIILGLGLNFYFLNRMLVWVLWVLIL